MTPPSDAQTVVNATPSPELLARIAHLRIQALRTVDGALSGLHRSPHRGASMTFVEHRNYAPGDDLRLLDWRAYARNDRYVIRRFEHESQQTAQLALDISSSMNFGNPNDGTRKLDYAATLLAALGHLLLRQGDAVGAMLWDNKVQHTLPARQRPQHFDALLEVLGQSPNEHGTTGLRSAVTDVLERTGRRTLVVLASDLVDFEDRALSGLATLRGAGHEVLVFHVLHRDELDLRLEGGVRVEGLEGEPGLDVDASAVADAYRRQVSEWLSRCETTCQHSGVRYFRAVTDTPAEEVLVHALADTRRRGWA